MNQKLDSALDELRSEYSQEQPGAHVQDAIFRAQRERRARRFWLQYGAAAAALVIGISIWSSARHRAPVAVTHSPVAAAPVTRPVQERTVVAENSSEAKPGPRVRRKSSTVRAAEVPPDPPFMAIPYAPPISENDRVEVYRVRMPRATVAGYGLPIEPGFLGGSVTADLAVGNDGIARAVRFVR